MPKIKRPVGRPRKRKTKKRNYKREHELQKETHMQIKFSVKREVGEKFKQHLEKNNITSISWFQYAISKNLIPNHEEEKRQLKLSQEEKDKILELLATNLSIKEVSEITKRNPKTISRIKKTASI